jgi:hypothetical protein
MAARLAERMPALVHDLLGEPNRALSRRDDWRYGRKGSLSVLVAGPKRGAWHDHEAGIAGDALGLVIHLRRCPMREALRWALAWLGDAPRYRGAIATQGPVALPEAPHAPSPSPSIDLARRVWAEAVVPAGTLVEIYLASRGLALPAAAPIRFHPACPRGAERWPAMVALMTDPEAGKPCGVHRTFLARDGQGKTPGPMPAKMMAGKAGVIRLAAHEGGAAALGIAEGIETALAIMQRAGWYPVWAATSAGAIARLPILAAIPALTVFADRDEAGMSAARACCRRWAAAGRTARLLAPTAGDWHDALPRGGECAA